MKVIAEYGHEDLAKVYVAKMRESDTPNKYLIEFVESIQPPIPQNKKWVLIVSSLFGCPIRCKMCDAGGDFGGKLSSDEIVEQVRYLVRRRYSADRVPVPKFKIQFARMGEPSLNPAVLDAMERLPREFDAPGLNVSISTVAPRNAATRAFFERLLTIKDRLYAGGRFQLQFSIHTTDLAGRDDLIPVKKWSFEEISEYGERFSHPETGDKKVTLNFAPVEGYPVEAAAIREHFDPRKFLIKLTPLNPTVKSNEESLSSAINPEDRNTSNRLIEEFRSQGYDVVLSIGELEENRIGSNCGQFIQRAIQSQGRPEKSYELERYFVRTDAG